MYMYHITYMYILYYCSYLQSQVPRVLVLGADVRGVGGLDSWIDGSLPLGVPACFRLSVVCWWRDFDGVSCGVVSWCGYTWRNHKHCQQGAVTLHVHACTCTCTYICIHTRVFLQTYPTLIHSLLNRHALSHSFQPFTHACVCLSMVALIVCLLVSKLYLHMCTCHLLQNANSVEWPFWAIFCLLSGAHRVAKQWVSILQSNNMFVGRLATVDMQSRCTCTCTLCTYVHMLKCQALYIERPCYHFFNVLWQVRGWGYCLLLSF